MSRARGSATCDGRMTFSAIVAGGSPVGLAAILALRRHLRNVEQGLEPVLDLDLAAHVLATFPSMPGR